MEFFDVLNNRRSVRRYSQKAPERELILKALEAADKAPSAMNTKPWAFAIASGAKVKELGQSLVAVLDQVMPANDGHSGAFKKFAADFGGAPYLVVVLAKGAAEPRYQNAYLESACAATQNLLLAAAALGLGTCWMTGPLMDEQGIRRILGIEADMQIVAVTPIGYPADADAMHPAAPSDIKVSWID